MADNRLSTFLPDDKAAFGVFPQMKPRRRLQDREASANVPLDVTRGRVAGLAGLLPDTLNFMGRSPMSTEMFGETQYEPTQQLPYGSEYFLQNLPLKPTSRIGEVAGQAGAFVPLNPMPAARAAAAGVKALGPTAGRMAEGYLQRQGLMPNIVPEAPQVPLGSMIEKPQAPVSPLGFYSAAEQAALNLPRKSGTGQSFMNDLMKSSDVKKDELFWIGLDDFLKDKPNVTKQEVQDFISANRVDVREVRLGDKEVKLPSTIGLLKREEILNKYQPKLDALYAEDANYANLTPQRYEELGQEIRALERQRDVEADAAYVIPPLPQLTPTKYERYQLPGGENYREILLTLPAAGEDVQKLNQISMQLHGKPYTEIMADTSEMAKMRLAVKREYKNQFGESGQNAQDRGMYRSSHFNEPNILAHMRVNDRVDADGKKMLLIEEIQSDWHQAGREKGYNTPEKRAAEQKKLDDLIVERQQLGERQKQLEELASPYTSQGKDAPTNILDEWNSVSNRLQRLQTEQNRLGRTTGEGVPDAPFKDTWHQLALKRALKYAADNGYDRVGLTTGKQQIDRYANQIRQNVDELQFFPIGNQNNILISAKKGGKQTFSGTVADNKFIDGPAEGKTVTEVLGKSMAKQIAEKKDGVIKGDDLTIGGEGMKAYYDEIYPAFLAKQGKKYNAKTGETTIGKKGTIEKSGTSYYQTPDSKATVRYIDISPEMKGGVKKGQPLFTAAPIGGIGVGAGMQDQQQNSLNSFIQ